ncbi:uncharacterized protein LOC110038476 [Phalaenopsis equestris]|uniref:uncharacterized protein LOC110038476 n=1 Tax=Phalaenopsis equestris TaxID=78828 RepID=UPI0009E2F687|nr:uncharacterized protein LOC110038476 [Phalaenopsis equestris]
MKIFGWVRSKITGRQEKKFDICHGFDHCFSKQNSCKEEFHGWPQTLLSIGTFSSNEMQNETQIISQTSESLQENGDLSIEEEIIFQKEISKLLNLKQVFSTDKTDQSSSLKLDNNSTSNICNGSTDDIILNNAKELLAAKHNEIRRRSLLSFLLKKMFVCRSGFAPQLSLRDPIPESWIEKV